MRSLFPPCHRITTSKDDHHFFCGKILALRQFFWPHQKRSAKICVILMMTALVTYCAAIMDVRCVWNLCCLHQVSISKYFFRPSFRPSIHPYTSICLSVCVSVCLSVCLSVGETVCLSVTLSFLVITKLFIVPESFLFYFLLPVIDWLGSPSTYHRGFAAGGVPENNHIDVDLTEPHFEEVG